MLLVRRCRRKSQFSAASPRASIRGRNHEFPKQKSIYLLKFSQTNKSANWEYTAHIHTHTHTHTQVTRCRHIQNPRNFLKQPRAASPHPAAAAPTLWRGPRRIESLIFYFSFIHCYIFYFDFDFYGSHTALSPLFHYKLFTTWSIFLNLNNSHTARTAIYIFAFSSRSHSRLTPFVSAHSIETRQRYIWWHFV